MKILVEVFNKHYIDILAQSLIIYNVWSDFIFSKLIFAFKRQLHTAVSIRDIIICL